MITIPPALTAATGMDALTHAIEAYIGRNSTSYTDQQALEAIRLIFKHLPTAVSDGSNIEARSALALASYKAGLAFTKASLGYVHAISHQLGAKYGVAHGLGNAIVLPHVIKYSAPSIQRELAVIANEIGIADKNESESKSASTLVDYLFTFNKEINIPDNVVELKEGDFSTIAEGAMSEAYFNYPVPRFMQAHQCEEILQNLLPNPAAE
jgi:alcohol dehydrogenase class IV